MNDDKVIITCALTGGMTVPAQSSAIPITVEQIVEDGVAAAESGASVLHIHVREESTGRPVADLELFDRVLSQLKERTDAVLQPTTGGGRLPEPVPVDPARRPVPLPPPVAVPVLRVLWRHNQRP